MDLELDYWKASQRRVRAVRTIGPQLF